MNSNLPNSTDLLVFTVVVRFNSFIKAADALGTSPAYISKRISILEKNLGCTLLHRKTRALRLTSQGESVYNWSQQIVHDIQEMKDLIKIQADLPSGSLTVTSSFGFGRAHVTPILANFHDDYPSINIKYELTDKVNDLIREHIDLDIRVGNTINPNLLAKFLHKNKRILCASPDYLDRKGTPNNLEDLIKHQCLVIKERDVPFGIWQLNSNKGNTNIKIAGHLAANDGSVVKTWALDGHGIVLRSIWDVYNDLENKKLVHIMPEYWQDADIWAVYPNRLSSSARLRVCVEYFNEVLPKRLAYLRDF